MAYFDTSAYLKLIRREPETEALEDEVRQWPLWTSSALLGIEAVRACRRYDEDLAAFAEASLGNVSLVAIDGPLIAAAKRLDPPGLRALDAIHLATAISLGDDLGALFSYDDHLTAAATAAGLRVLAPA